MTTNKKIVTRDLNILREKGLLEQIGAGGLEFIMNSPKKGHNGDNGDMRAIPKEQDVNRTNGSSPH